MASTFPLEVVAAARWVEDPAHKSLSGDALVKALTAEPWDPSVKSLVPFPVVLATMNGNLTWLQQLGYAFATQQADVFAAVQRLRRLAQANDKLQSSPQQVVSTQQVTVEPAGGQQPAPDAAGGDRHPAGAAGHRLRAELQSGNGVRLVVALPVISAVLPGPAAGLLFRHRAGHRAGICGRRRGRGRAMGLGESRVGRRLRERQCQPIQQHQRQPAQINSNRWGGGAGSGRPGNFARAPGGPAGLPGRSQVSVPGNAVRPPTRRAEPEAWAVSAALVGRAVPVAWAVSVVLAGRVVPAAWAVPAGRAVPAAWAVSAARAGQVVPAAWAASAARAGRVVPAAWAVSAARAGQVVPAAWAVSAARAAWWSRRRRRSGVGSPVAPGARQASAAAGWRRPGLRRRATSSGAFGDMNRGRQAGQFGQRGAQSRSFGQQRSAGGGARGGGGFERWRAAAARGRWPAVAAGVAVVAVAAARAISGGHRWECRRPGRVRFCRWRSSGSERRRRHAEATPAPAQFRVPRGGGGGIRRSPARPQGG